MNLSIQCIDSRGVAKLRGDGASELIPVEVPVK